VRCPGSRICSCHSIGACDPSDLICLEGCALIYPESDFSDYQHVYMQRTDMFECSRSTGFASNRDPRRNRVIILCVVLLLALWIMIALLACMAPRQTLWKALTRLLARSEPPVGVIQSPTAVTQSLTAVTQYLTAVTQAPTAVTYVYSYTYKTVVTYVTNICEA
jgi:hypothetical protein